MSCSLHAIVLTSCGHGAAVLFYTGNGGTFLYYIVGGSARFWKLHLLVIQHQTNRVLNYHYECKMTDSRYVL